MPWRLAEQTNVVRAQFTLNEVAICFVSYRFALIILKACACFLQKFMQDFKSRALCLFGLCFASCFKKMRNSKMKEKNSNTFLNDRQQVKLFLYVWRISCTGY